MPSPLPRANPRVSAGRLPNSRQDSIQFQFKHKDKYPNNKSWRYKEMVASLKYLNLTTQVLKSTSFSPKVKSLEVG